MEFSNFKISVEKYWYDPDTDTMNFNQYLLIPIPWPISDYKLCCKQQLTIIKIQFIHFLLSIIVTTLLSILWHYLACINDSTSLHCLRLFWEFLTLISLLLFANHLLKIVSYQLIPRPTSGINLKLNKLIYINDLQPTEANNCEFWSEMNLFRLTWN